MDAAAAKERVVAAVDAAAPFLVDVSHRIHANPELLFEEHAACALLRDALADAGFAVQAPAYGLDTAFRAGRGDGAGPLVAVLCEYDALPGIGHACGHNVIAAAGLGAGLAAASVVDELGGRLVVLGTPAEEGGGGKIYMGERGAFDGVDAAMMVHPAGLELTELDAIAIATWRVTYRGRAAHAAAYPHLGRNALDAAVLGYNAVAALRQHIRPSERVHGVFTRGGDKANIVPELAVAEWYVRSDTIDTLQPLKARVRACLEAGAAAAGCELSIEAICPEYADLRTNAPLVEAYRANVATLGREAVTPSGEARVVGSTDMGNVSHLVPSIHPVIKVSPAQVSIHSVEFARWAAQEAGDRAVLDGAKALAMTAADVWASADLSARAHQAFIHDSTPRDP